MREQINYKCAEHPEVSECPDKLIDYSPKFDEYGILIHDGGSSSISIEFCPWCGIKLPESKRDLWFDTLEELGFDDPFAQEIPKEFETSEWFANK